MGARVIVPTAEPARTSRDLCGRLVVYFHNLRTEQTVRDALFPHRHSLRFQQGSKSRVGRAESVLETSQRLLSSVSWRG